MPGRARAVLVRYTDAEYADVADAARCAGLTPSGYVAEAALAGARVVDGPALRPERAALAELVRARVQVRKFGVNVNQAVRQLNGLGEAPPWLGPAVTVAGRAVAELEAAAAAMVAATRRQVAVRPPGPHPSAAHTAAPASQDGGHAGDRTGEEAAKAGVGG